MFGFIKNIFTSKPNYKYKAVKMHPMGEQIIDWLWNNNWEEIDKEYTANDAGNKTLMIDICVTKYFNESLYDDWIEKEPDNAHAYLFKGAHMVKLGWNYRSADTADNVSEKQFEKFWNALQIAYDNLLKAIKLSKNPFDRVEAHYHLQNVMRGLQLEPDLEEMNYNDLESWDVDHLLGANSYLSANCAKWGGSHEDMFGFARAVAASTKAPGYMQSILCVAHTERWLYAAVFQDDDDDDKLEADDYFNDPTVIAELEAADDKFTFQNEGQIWGFDLIAANEFAYIWSRVGNFKRAKRHFDAIGYSIGDGGWGYHKSTFTTLNRAKAMTVGAN